MYVRLCTDVLVPKQTEQEMMMFIYATAVHDACFIIDVHSLDVSSEQEEGDTIRAGAIVLWWVLIPFLHEWRTEE